MPIPLICVLSTTVDNSFNPLIVCAHQSCGLCYAHPGFGKICGISFCATAIMFIFPSNKMLLALVVPSSSARIYFFSILISFLSNSNNITGGQTNCGFLISSAFAVQLYNRKRSFVNIDLKSCMYVAVCGSEL